MLPNIEFSNKNLIRRPQPITKLPEQITKSYFTGVMIWRCWVGDGGWETRKPSIKTSLLDLVTQAAQAQCDGSLILRKERFIDFVWERYIFLTTIYIQNDHMSAIADHVKTTGHNIKWDHFEILASCKTDYLLKSKKHCLSKNLSQLLMSTSAVRS